MYEGSIPLDEFLDTMNRLQDDFERRLGGIERATSPKPQKHTRGREETDFSQPREGEKLHRPFGLEAIWTDFRRKPDRRASSTEKPFSTTRPDDLVEPYSTTPGFL